MFGFGAAPPGAGLALALLVLATLFAAPTPTEAQTTVTLTSNLNQSRQTGPFVGPNSSNQQRLRAQRFTTGSNESGYTVLSVELRLESVRAGSVPSVSIHTVSGQNPAANALYELTNPSTIANGTRKFDAPANATLEKDTNYFVVIGGSGERYGIEVTTASGESGADGWSILDSHRNRFGTFAWSNNPGESVKLRIKGSINAPPINTAATGKPGIDGTPQVGQTLTATAGNMADDDNLPATTFPAGYSFQWVQVDGTTETEIGGATSQTYDPVTGDVGKTLKVKVAFTDGGGNEETLTSDETDAVVAAPPPPVTPTLEAAEAFFVNGALRYRFDLKLSEAVAIPFLDMRDHAFSVTNGYVAEAKRIHKDRRTEGGQQRLYSNHWRMTVAPVDETKPVTVTLRGNRPCSEKGALCTGSGNRVDNSPALTLSTGTTPPDLSNLPSLSIADTSGTEDSANLAFDVSLSKAVSATIAVDFRTVSGGTANKNADYREVSYRILFPAGETVQPGSVALMEDAVNDAGETVNVEITNARVITPRGAEFGPLSIARGQATGTINAPASSTTPLSNVNMRIENTSGSESVGWLHFTIKLSRALDENVCYDFESLDAGTATEGVDYLQRPKSTSWQAAGVTEWTEFVRILDDSIADGGETVKVRISDAELCEDASKTITIHRREATGTITNSDPIPAAWLARFGRTVADHVTAAVSDRLAGPLAGAQVTVGGQTMNLAEIEDDAFLGRTLSSIAQVMGAPSGPGQAANDPGSGSFGTGPGHAGVAPWLGTGLGVAESPTLARTTTRDITGRVLLLGSAFHLAREGDGNTPGLAAWGRVTVGGVDGEAPADAGNVRIEGDVTTGILGADAERGRMLAGVAVSVSEGEGTFDQPGVDSGTIESTMTTVSPYARVKLSDRVSAWGLASVGTGDMTIVQKANDATGQPERITRTDLSMRLAALGGRGALLQADGGGGFDLALKADGFLVETTSEAVSNEGDTTADASRVRLALEGSRAFQVGGAVLTPGLELGLRHDGGDAETGMGVELGGRLTYTDRESGLSMEASVRTLVAHEDSDYEEWGASGSIRFDPGAVGQGLSFSLAPTYGTPSGGVDRLWSARDARGLAPNSGTVDPESRLEGELGYGIALPGGFTGTPNLGFGLTGGGARDVRVGWRLTPAGAAGFEVNLDATRRESVDLDGADAAPVEHGVVLRGSVRW